MKKKVMGMVLVGVLSLSTVAGATSAFAADSTTTTQPTATAQPAAPAHMGGHFGMKGVMPKIASNLTAQDKANLQAMQKQRQADMALMQQIKTKVQTIKTKVADMQANGVALTADQQAQYDAIIKAAPQERQANQQFKAKMADAKQDVTTKAAIFIQDHQGQKPDQKDIDKATAFAGKKIDDMKGMQDKRSAELTALNAKLDALIASLNA